MAQPLIENTPYIDIQDFKKLKNGQYKATLRMYGYESILDVYDDNYEIDGQKILTTITRVGYGDRKWFLCPCCFQNTKRLYHPYRTASWKCRECHHLIYRTSRLSGNDLEYIDHKIEQLQSLFDMSHSYNYGGLPGAIHEQIPLFKPKYMRGDKFYRIEKELKILIKKRVTAWMKYL